MDMDRTGAYVVLNGLLMKHKALAKTDSEFAEIHQQIAAAIDIALEALNK